MKISSSISLNSGYDFKFYEWYGEDLLNDIIKLILEYEFRTNSYPERIDYLKKLTTEKDDIARNDGEVSISSRRDRGRPKDSKDRKSKY